MIVSGKRKILPLESGQKEIFDRILSDYGPFDRFRYSPPYGLEPLSPGGRRVLFAAGEGFRHAEEISKGNLDEVEVLFGDEGNNSDCQTAYMMALVSDWAYRSFTKGRELKAKMEWDIFRWIEVGDGYSKVTAYLHPMEENAPETMRAHERLFNDLMVIRGFARDMARGHKYFACDR